MKSNLFFKILLIICIIVSLYSCKKSATSGAPAIPPVSTMSMDFTFTGTQKATSTSLADSSNFIISYAIVNYWMVAAGYSTFIPSLAFNAVITGGVATFNEDTNTWTWTKDFNTTVNQKYLAILSGKIAGDSISWVMNIQTIGQENIAVKYFEGVSKTHSGWWKIYTRDIGNSITSSPALRIDWEKTSETVGFLKYTNIIDGDANNGSYIGFGKIQNTLLDRYFTAKIISLNTNESVNGKDYIIEWSSTTREGDIKWDGGQGCWDNTLKNITCP